MAADAPLSVLWKYLPRQRAPQASPDDKRGHAFSADRSQAIKLRYLVTGTGRSGTVSLACALTRAGIPCSHERFFRGGSAEDAAGLLASGAAQNSYCSSHCGLPERGDEVIAESSYLAAPHLAAPLLTDTTVIHAVRSPWKVIPSFLNGIQFFRDEPIHQHERFIYGVLPELWRIDNPVDRAAYYYIHWNLMIEWLGTQRTPAKYVFHRVEDGPERLLRQLGVTLVNRNSVERQGELNSFKDWQAHMKPAPASRIPVEALLRSKYRTELSMLAERYGYDSLPELEADKGVQDETSVEGELETASAPPLLVEGGYRGFNLVHWRNTYYGLDQVIGAVDLQTAGLDLLKELADRGACLAGGSMREVKDKVTREVSRRAGDKHSSTLTKEGSVLIQAEG